MKVYVEGRLQTRKWQDQSGNDRYTTEIISQTIQNLTPRGSDMGSGGYEEPPMPSEPKSFDPIAGDHSTGEDVPF